MITYCPLLRRSIALLFACTLAFGVTTASAGQKPCIAIAPPQAQLGQGATGQDVAGPVQNMLMSYLSGPLLEVVVLQSRLPAQLTAEARQSGCDYILTADVQYKQKKRWGKALSLGAGIASSALPYAGMGGSVSSYVATATAANVANTAANVQLQQESMESLTAAQGTIRKGDSISLGYQLDSIKDGKTLSKNTFEEKASQDGQDLLLPLIEEAASEVFTNVTR
ncbi:hypothetical protein [uncultured Porticoccus sp.]|uniref:hypothetical protein n=1 Tax=uncultured Porticoccus sp. TaxID=1256050 RepID=UPI0030D6FE6F|tara:strand:+ start:646 stop:1317 length:672 start_codon:yes stop_codon:yes gene_type:complete